MAFPPVESVEEKKRKQERVRLDNQKIKAERQRQQKIKQGKKQGWVNPNLQTADERRDRYLESQGLLNYQTKGLSQVEIAQRYGNAGIKVDANSNWWKDNYKDRPVDFSGAFPTQAPPSGSNQQSVDVEFATNDMVLTNQANWTDMSAEERKKILSDPNFYKGGITKYSPGVQQQILADSDFNWDNLPKWQRMYYSFSSQPTQLGPITISPGTKMGALQGLVMGGGNPGGSVLGGVIGWAAGVTGYDPSKEFWQQGDDNNKMDIGDFARGAFGLLNFGAEQAEKGIGFGVQVAASLANSDKYGSVQDLLSDPKSAWNAGSTTFENFSQQLSGGRDLILKAFETGDPFGYIEQLHQEAPKGSVLEKMLLGAVGYVIKPTDYVLGSADKVEVNDSNFFELMKEVRERVKSGEDYRQVMLEFQTGINAQIGDMAGQGLADPLNFAGKAEAKVGEVTAKITGDTIATEAFRGADGLFDARTKLQNIINTPGEALKINPNFKIDEMGWMTKALSGLSNDNKVRASWLNKSDSLLNNQDNNFTLGGLLTLQKKDWGGFGRYLTSLDPQSRARTGLDLLARNIGNVGATFFKNDVDGFAKWLTKLSSGDLNSYADAADVMLQSPELYTAIPMMKGYDVQGKLAKWQAGETGRADVGRIADSLGENPMTLIERLTQEDGMAYLQERLRTKGTPEANSILADIQAGRLDLGVLNENIKGFAEGSLTYHPGAWMAEVMADINDYASEWSVKHFRLDEQSKKTLFRTAHVLKSVQSILLLGVNPGYMISNVLPTMVTRAVDGVFGYMTPKSIDTFMTRMGFDLKEGFQPNRLDEVSGLSSNEMKIKSDPITKAVEGKGFITNAHQVIKKIGRSLPINALSRILEPHEGRQGHVISIKQFMGQAWRRGKGFREIPAGLVKELETVAGKRATDILYNAIEAGMTKAEINNIVSGGRTQVLSRSLINQAAQDLNIPVSRAGEMLEKVGILDALDSELRNAKTETSIRAGFERAKRNAQESIDRQAALDATARIEHIANRMSTEGMKAITDIVIDTEMRGMENHLRHFERMGEVADAMDSIDNPNTRSRLWSLKYSESNAEYRRYNAQRGTTYLGILKAVGLESGESGRGFLSTLADTDKAIDNAYRLMRDLRDDHFKKWNSDYDNPRRNVERSQVESQIDSAWKQATETELNNLAKLGEYMGKQYEQLYGIEAGEAARQAWESIVAFRQEMVTRRDAFRASIEGLPTAQRNIESKKFWGETYNYMIVEMGRIKTEAIERLDRIARGKPDAGDATPTPSPTDPNAPTSPAPARTDEMARLREQAEQRKQVEAERLDKIWQSSEPFGFTSKEKHQLISSLNKYGDFEVTSYDDPRLTPEYVQDVLTRRQSEKERIRIQQEEVAVGTALNRAQQEFISKPRSELPEVLSNALLGEAQRITDVILGGEPGRKLFADGEFIGTSGSTYPKWYNDLQQVANGRTSLLRALDKIVKDAGVDKGPVVQRVKEFLLMTLKYGDSDTNSPPNLNVMKALGADDVTLQNAADNFNDMMGTNFTVEQLTREAGDLIPNYEGALSDMTAFDSARWETDMFNAFESADITRLHTLVDEIPSNLLDETINELSGETYRTYVDRVMEEANAKVADDQNRLAIAEKITLSEEALQKQTDAGERTFNRERYYESLTDVFKLSEEEAKAVMEITDAADRWYSNASGLDEGAFYRDYIESVERGSEADLFQREQQQGLFGAGEDTPLFSGVPQKAKIDEFRPTAEPKQEGMFDTRPQFGTGEISYAPTVPSVKGGVRFLDNGKAVIKAWQNADISTIIHENGHIFRRMMEDVAGKTDNQQVKLDYEVLSQWAGVKDGNWTRAAEEKFARGFEKYLADGSAPTPQLKRVFQQFKAWMMDIYQSITGSAIDIDLTPQVKEAFDRLLTGEVNVKKLDMQDQLRQMGYDSKAYYIDIDGTVKRRPEFNIRVDKEGVSKQSDDLISNLQQKAQALKSRAKPVDTLAQLNVEVPARGTPVHNMTYDQYAAMLLQDQREFAQRRIDTLSDADYIAKSDFTSMKDVNTEIAKMKQLLKRDSVSYVKYGDVKEMYRAKIEQALINELPVPDDIKQAYYRMGKSGELSKAEQSYLQDAKQVGNEPVRELFQMDNRLRVFVNMTREQFLGKPIITKNDNASNLKPNEINTLKDVIAEPFGSLTAKFSRDGAAVYDGEKVIASYNFGDTLVVDKAYRKLGIAEELVYQFRTRYPDVPPSKSRTKTAQHIQEKVWERIQRELNETNSNILFQDADPRMPLGGYEEMAGWMPHSEVMNEGWAEHITPLLDQMQETAIRNLNDPQMDGVYAGLSEAGKKQLNNYLKGVQQDLASTKMGALRWGAEKRDFSMLNYSKRTGLDNYLDVVFPYQFFYTRSMMTWAMRALDNPAWLSNYARVRRQQDRYENNLPERLRGKFGVDAPWLPDWMGDKLYIDPLSVLFTPHNFMRPFEQMMKDQNMQTIEAERVLQEWAAEGTYSDEQIVEAVKTRSGDVWEQALSEAGVRREAEISNPMDFISTTFGPAWYLSTPAKLLGLGKDDAETLTELPLTRTARAFETVTDGTWAEPLGNLVGLLAKPEEMFRKAQGLPEFGEYGDYYIDRQLANMVAEGLITSEDAQIAMIEREGEYFDEAKDRVQLELAMRVPLMGAVYAGTHGENVWDGMWQAAKALPVSLFGAGVLPEGELHYRGLKDDWNEAWKRYDAGDKQAITNFFEENPEYESYLAKGKEPEERLKSFLIGQIWDGYMALGYTDQRTARSEMGELFQQSFLDKETRSYDTLDIETLTEWAQMLNKRVPKTEQTLPAIQNPPKQIDFYSPEITKITDEYYRQRNELHPNYYEAQNAYYALPKSERRAYLLAHHELKAYWDWKKKWETRYPDLVPIFKGEVFRQVDFSGWNPMLMEYVATYAYAGEEIPVGAWKALEQMWINEGRPYGTVQEWLDRDVAPAIMYSN